MARLDIEAKVTGLNEVKQLDREIDKLEKNTKKTNTSLASLATRFAGAATAGIILGKAMRDLAQAGIDYKKSNEQVTQSLQAQEKAQCKPAVTRQI